MTPLQTELAKPEYAGKTDADVAAMLAAPITIGRRPISSQLIRQEVFAAGAWPALDQARSGSNATLAAIARMACDLMQGPAIDVGMDRKDFHDAISALVTNAILPQTFVDALNAAANVTTTRAKQLGMLFAVTAEAITKARKGM